MNSAFCTIKRTFEDQHKPILKSAVYVIKKEYQTNHHRTSLTKTSVKKTINVSMGYIMGYFSDFCIITGRFFGNPQKVLYQN